MEAKRDIIFDKLVPDFLKIYIALCGNCTNWIWTYLFSEKIKSDFRLAAF